MPPKKKSTKKKVLGPKLKAPIGRPRKNLGTRVSDLPLVSTVKPTTRRVNIDSLAMNRARLAYKRDYGKTLDEYTSRALIDAMSTSKRGPIGTSVVGTVKGKEVVLGTSTEASGFFDYYKKAKKAAETNPSQKTTLKRKSDDTWVVITPGIPAVTSGTIAATTVPKTSAKSAKSAADRAAKLEDLNAKQTKLVELLQSGSLSPAASKDAKERLKQIEESILSLSIGSDSPVVSPLDDAASLVKERRNLDEIARDPRFTPAERNAAEVKRDRLDKNILEFKAAKRATERDIVEAQLGPLDKQSKMEADLVEERQNLRAIRYFKDATQDQINQAQARIAEINEELAAINQARAPLISGVVPTRTIRRDEAGPSTASATAPRAPATEKDVEAVEAAFADPAVSAIVEQAQANAPVKSGPSSTPMQKLAKAANRKKEERERAERFNREQARAAEYRAELENAPGRTREQIAADVQERDPGDPGLEPYMPRGRFLTQVPERLIEEAALYKQALDSAPAIQSLVRGYQTRKQLKKEADMRKYNELLKKRRAYFAEARENLNDVDLANLAEQGDQSVSIPSEERRARRVIAEAKIAREAALAQIAQERDPGDPGLEPYMPRGRFLTQVPERLIEEAALYKQALDSAPAIQSLVRGYLARKRLKKEADMRLIEREAALDQQALDEYAQMDAERRQRRAQEAAYAPQKQLARSIAELEAGIQREGPDKDLADLMDARNAVIAARQEVARQQAENERLYQQQEKDKALMVLQDKALREVEFQRRLAEQAALELGEPVPVQRNIPTTTASAFSQGWSNVFPSATIPPPPPPPLSLKQAPTKTKRAPAKKKDVPVPPNQPTIPEQITIPSFVKDVIQRAAIDESELQEQASKLKRVVKQEDVAPVVQNLIKDVIADALAARRLAVRPDAPVDDNDDDWETSPNPYSGRGLVGGVLRRLRGMGYFDGFNSLMYNVHGTPDDNKKDLAAAKAAYAAKGGAPGTIVLSGVPTPMTGGSDWTLQAVTFPDTDWKSSSSLRWLRSSGIKPMKKADKQGTLFRYRIEDPKKFTDYYTSDLMSRGRKIHLVYGK